MAPEGKCYLRKETRMYMFSVRKGNGHYKGEKSQARPN